MRRYLLVLLALAMLPFGVAGTSQGFTGSGLIYVEMSDDVEIAVQLFYPNNYNPNASYPVLMQIEGYGGAASPNDSTYRQDGQGQANASGTYVVLAVSLRGTGCSGGELDLFSDRSSLDGKEILDNWLPTQTVFNWNGKAGIYGHSYGGLTGFLVAAQTPTNLHAVAVSGLIDDFYRGILYPGGVPNPGFPVLWGAGVRPAGEHAPNASHYANDAHCRANFAQHNGTDVLTVKGLMDTYPNREAKPDTWAIQQGLMDTIGGIQAPIQLGQQYQDEQTGPRGGYVLYENIPAGVPKRLVLSTGRHNPNDPTLSKRDWLDCWMLGGTNAQSGKPCSEVTDARKRVLLHFEHITGATPVRPAPLEAADWPLPQTDWRRFNFCADGTLSETPTSTCDGDKMYASSGTGRHMTLDVGAAAPTGAPLSPLGFTSGLPDTLRYELPFNGTQVIAGPMSVDLWATATSTDVDFWVEILDKDLTTGATTFVQRGIQRASFAAGFDATKSQTVPAGPRAGEVYRPYHSFIGPQPITPGQANLYHIEVFPLGHVWRPGHALVLQVHAPPANDPISTYAYEPNQASVVTIHQDASHRTSILLPFVNGVAAAHYRATPPGCGQVNGEICITPALG